MRIMGLDVGDKTIGVAVSDPLGWTAQGIETLRRGEDTLEKDIMRLLELIGTWEVEQVVLGLPRNMDGSQGPQAEKVRAFAQKLQEATSVPLIFWDERLTTIAAQKTLIQADLSRAKRKQVVDKMAAVLILQSYLDSRGRV